MQQMKGFYTVQAVNSAKNSRREGNAAFGWICVGLVAMLTVCMIVSFFRQLRSDREIREYLRNRWNTQR